MRPDRRFQHLVRQRHKAILDAAKQRRRPFHQTGNFVNQRRIRAQGCALCRNQCRCPFDNRRAPRCRVNHHMAVAQPGNIPVSAVDPGKRDIAAMFEIMAAAGRAEINRPATQIQRTGKRRPVEQHIDPVQGSHPAKARSAPPLAFRPGKAGQHGCNDIGQQIGCRRPLLFNAGKQETALWRILFHQRIAGQSG